MDDPRQAEGTEIPELVRTAVSALPDPAVILDAELKVVHFNQAYRRMAGLNALEDPAKGRGALLCTDLLELEICRTTCAARACIRQGRSLSFHEVRCAAGPEKASTFNVQVTCFPVASGGGPVGMVEIYRDTTAERHVQERFQRLLDLQRHANLELDRLVHERTAELRQSLEELQKTREQLVQAEKLRSLGELVAGIAHEINNPVNFIYGNTPFLKEHFAALFGLLDLVGELKSLSSTDRGRFEAAAEAADLAFIRNDAEKLIRTFHVAAERIAHIVRGLRTIGRVGGVEMEATDLGECLSATAAILAPLFKEEVRLEQKVELGETVRCNPSQIGQLMTNLIKNAREAICGPGAVDVSLSRQDTHALLVVVDNGAGIPPEMLPRVFDPFFTTKPVGVGQGLGLAICYSIAKAHGGTIEVDSTVGKGTRVTVKLPLEGPPASAEVAAPAATDSDRR
ncbi:MAG: PAS domain-containing protein [Myxococcales bacterium]|nr:PAS domain-containing protein [Myxococcales bacterium]